MREGNRRSRREGGREVTEERGGRVKYVELLSAVHIFFIRFPKTGKWVHPTHRPPPPPIGRPDPSQHPPPRPKMCLPRYRPFPKTRELQLLQTIHSQVFCGFFLVCLLVSLSSLLASPLLCSYILLSLHPLCFLLPRPFSFTLQDNPISKLLEMKSPTTLLPLLADKSDNRFEYRLFSPALFAQNFQRKVYVDEMRAAGFEMLDVDMLTGELK